MVCSVQDLREREIINLKDGARLGIKRETLEDLIRNDL